MDGKNESDQVKDLTPEQREALRGILARIKITGQGTVTPPQDTKKD